MQRIVIVGGGAGGLALATQLGKRLGKKGLAEITLVDAARTHVWKPLLHQLAAGSFDTHAEEIEYLAQARWNNFKFRLGRLEGLDRRSKTLHLAASHDEAGREIQRTFVYSFVFELDSNINHDRSNGFVDVVAFIKCSRGSHRRRGQLNRVSPRLRPFKYGHRGKGED